MCSGVWGNQSIAFSYSELPVPSLSSEEAKHILGSFTERKVQSRAKNFKCQTLS